MARAHLRAFRRTSAKALAAFALLQVLILACATLDEPDPMPTGELAELHLLFQQHCNDCHGWSGRGDGWHATMLERSPRNFRAEKFKYISSEGTEAPGEDDPLRLIGPGGCTGHTPTHPELTDAQLRGLVDYVREIHRIGVAAELTELLIEEDEDFEPEEVEEISRERTEPGTPLIVPPRPPGYRTIDLWGATRFAELCSSCHGEGGQGDGPQAEGLTDELGRLIRPRNFTLGVFHGGATDRDLYLRIRCGLPGTPMPSFGPDTATDMEVWQLVDHLRVLARGG